jgi:hypothetical protein
MIARLVHLFKTRFFPARHRRMNLDELLTANLAAGRYVYGWEVLNG